MPDAGNLAAFLLRLRNENGGAVYQRIVNTIRMIAPFFQDFDLEPSGPNRNEVILNWLSDSDEPYPETGTEGKPVEIFGPHQLSDGTLRAMCLIALLLQPEDELPDLIVIDEPELGLHPYALNIIGALVKKTSQHAQILVSTQSTSFLECFDAEDIIVVNRVGNSSELSRPNAEQLKTWLEEYSLGELWEKNVIGGGPH